ncbi:MAG: hypothetical protein AAF572_20915, partial [Cyanobacteria bacterium P01_B01_bin.77]
DPADVGKLSLDPAKPNVMKVYYTPFTEIRIPQQGATANQKTDDSRTLIGCRTLLGNSNLSEWSIASD